MINFFVNSKVNPLTTQTAINYAILNANKLNRNSLDANKIDTKKIFDVLKNVNPLTTQTAINYAILNADKLTRNSVDANKIDAMAIYNHIKKVNADNEEFFNISNKIIHNVFDTLKININITSYNETYTFKSGNIKITINAKSGGNLSFNKDEFIFINSEYRKAEGILTNLMDITFQFSNIPFISQIKKDIELFKEKVGKSIVNGSVAIKFEFGKLIYEFDIAKKDDISKLYGTLTITLELDFDLSKAVEAVGEKVSNLIARYDEINRSCNYSSGFYYLWYCCSLFIVNLNKNIIGLI